MPDYGDDRGFRMNVPQRVVRPNIGVDRVGPGTNYNGGYGGKVQNPAISFSSQPGGPSNEYLKRPMGRGRFEGRSFGPPPNIGIDRMGGIFSGRNAGSDMMSDYYNNQLGWGDQLQSAIGGAGEVTPTQYTDDDKAIQRGLWKQANKNVNPEGMTPMPQIIQEWERLQEEYWRLKAQGYRPGE